MFIFNEVFVWPRAYSAVELKVGHTHFVSNVDVGEVFTRYMKICKERQKSKSNQHFHIWKINKINLIYDAFKLFNK